MPRAPSVCERLAKAAITVLEGYTKWGASQFTKWFMDVYGRYNMISGWWFGT